MNKLHVRTVPSQFGIRRTPVEANGASSGFWVGGQMEKGKFAYSRKEIKLARLTSAVSVSALAVSLNMMSFGFAWGQSVPQTLLLENATGSSGGTSGKVCVIGSSVALKDPTNGSTLVPAYYLQSSGQWATIPSNSFSINAYDLSGSLNGSLTTLPSGQSRINAARVYFYYVPNSGYNCNSIKFAGLNTDGSGLQVPSYQYPAGIVEYTADSSGLHIDTSNVDSTQSFMNMQVTTTDGKTFLMGNPINKTNVTTTAAVNGFRMWLALQAGSNCAPDKGVCPFFALDFPNLAPFPNLLSPTQYLNLKCTRYENGGFYPLTPACSAATRDGFLNFTSPLNRVMEIRASKRPILVVSTRRRCANSSRGQYSWK